MRYLINYICTILLSIYTTGTHLYYYKFVLGQEHTCPHGTIKCPTSKNTCQIHHSFSKYNYVLCKLVTQTHTCPIRYNNTGQLENVQVRICNRNQSSLLHLRNIYYYIRDTDLKYQRTVFFSLRRLMTIDQEQVISPAHIP